MDGWMDKKYMKTIDGWWMDRKKDGWLDGQINK